MVEINFYLSDDDADRLYALKDEAGEDQMTGNRYAQELLERTIHRLHPERVQYDDKGNRIPRRAAK